VAVVALGDAAAAGGPAPGWSAAQSLPTVGWGAALAAGAVVTSQGNRVGDNRERADGGWVTGYELARAAQVATVFTDPVSAVAIVIDDYVGSDAAGQVAYASPPPTNAGVPITRVTRLSAGGVTIPGGTQFDLLAIDRRTFASAAYWRSGLSDVPLDRIIQLLGATTGPMPVVLTGSDETMTAITVQDRDLPVQVVATARAFPGIASGRPLVVVAADRLVAAFPDILNPLTAAGASTELWARGPDAASALRGLRYPPDPVFTARGAEDVPHIAVVVDTFAVLDVVGVAGLILVVAAVLMYLQSRQRARIVSIALSRRMGLDAGAERRAIFIEIASMLSVALVVGSATALATAALIVPLLDPIASIPPAPFLELPLGRLAVALAGVVVASWLGARVVERATRNIPLSEVMRGVE
jgi:hypothetical protein